MAELHVGLRFTSKYAGEHYWELEEYDTTKGVWVYNFYNKDRIKLATNGEHESEIQRWLSNNKEYKIISATEKVSGPDRNKYPHTCLKCGAPAYHSLFTSDCSAMCS
jgi:hypothetical protein